MNLTGTQLKDLKILDHVIDSKTINNVFKNVDISESGLSTVGLSADYLYIKDSNITVVEVFPTNVDIPAGTPDTLDAMKSLMPDIKEEGFNESGMTYIEAVPAQMKLTFNMCSNHEKSKSDMIIDFGDGTVISTKDYTSDTEANPKLEVVQKSDYGRWDYKIEYTYSKPGKYIVTVRGKNYYTIR